MKYNDYKNYDAYVNDQVSYYLRRIDIYNDYYEYPEKIEMIPNDKCYVKEIIVTDHNGEKHKYQYSENCLKIDWVREELPIVSPEYFYSHGGNRN